MNDSTAVMVLAVDHDRCHHPVVIRIRTLLGHMIRLNTEIMCAPYFRGAEWSYSAEYLILSAVTLLMTGRSVSLCSQPSSTLLLTESKNIISYAQDLLNLLRPIFTVWQKAAMLLALQQLSSLSCRHPPKDSIPLLWARQQKQAK